MVEITYFARFILIDLHYRYLRLLYRIAALLDHRMGLKVMLRNLFKPLFGFPGYSARITGFVFRVTAITLGTFIIFLFLFLGLALYPSVLIASYVILKEAPILLPILITGMVLIYWYRLNRYPFRIFSKVEKILLFWQFASDADGRKILSQIHGKNKLHLIATLKDDKKVLEYLNKTELDVPGILEFLGTKITQVDDKKVFAEVASLAKKYNVRFIYSDLLFVAILKHTPQIDDFLAKNDLDTEFIEKCLSFIETLGYKEPQVWDDDYTIPPAGGVDKAWATGASAVLNKFSTDYTKMALKGYMPKLVGREEIKQRVISTLSKSNRNNVLLIGDAGCGKTTFIQGLAREIAVGTAIPALRYKRVLSLNITKELVENLPAIIKEIEQNGNIILFVDEIHNLSSTLAGDPNAAQAFSMLEPHLSSGKFQFIGATSKSNFTRYVKPNEAFTKVFDVVEMRPATDEETVGILGEVIKNHPQRNRIHVTYRAVDGAIKFAKRYVHISVLPDSAVELITLAISEGIGRQSQLVTAEDLAKLVSEKTGVPVSKIDTSERDVLLNLETSLHARVIGQNNAIKSIVNAIKRSRVDVRDISKPIASFLFLGPTGVGKTETAKSLAAIYYGDEKMMIRLDMSEFQEIQGIQRLIGSSDGQIGLLTSGVHEKPYSLLLIDEIEKANDKILNLFLQVLDDGRLTDTTGKTTDFSNTLIIMTSNVGTREILKSIDEGKGPLEIHQTAMEAVKGYFPPEFLNRFTSIIPFDALSKEQMLEITKLKLKKVVQNMARRHITVNFSDSTVRQIAETGYSPEWGARPLNRMIEDKIETMLADKIITGELKNGDTIIV